MIDLAIAFVVGGAVTFCAMEFVGAKADNERIKENDRLRDLQGVSGSCTERTRKIVLEVSERNLKRQIDDCLNYIEEQRDVIGVLQTRLADIADAVRGQQAGTAKKVLRMAEGG